MNASSSVKKSPIYFSKPVKIIATLFIGLYLIIWAISSPVSKYFISPILVEQGLTLSPDTSIRYNPFMSQLTISDLTLYLDKEEKVLSINELTIRLTLFRLLFDKIVISKFQLDNAYIKINKTETQLVIAGVDLNKENTNTNQEKIIDTESKPESFDYQLILPKLDFSQINIDIENNNKPHHIVINNLLITQVKASEQSQQAKINLQSIIDGTELTLDADAEFEQGQGEVSTQLAIIDYPIAKLQRYVEDLSELSGSFSLVSEQSISITTDQIKVHLNEAEIINKNLIVGYEQQFFTLEKLQQNISDLKLTLNQGEIIELSGEGQLTLNKASVHHNTPSQKLAYFEQLALNDMSFHFTDIPEVKIAEFIIDNILVSKNEDTELPPIVQLKQFSINDITISEHYLAVNQIRLDSLHSQIIMNKEKAISNLVTMPVTETEQEEITEVVEEADQEINATKADFIVSINEFLLINDNQLSFVDNSVEPAGKRNVFIDKLTLGALSNAQDKKDNQTPFELIGRSNKYAHFDFKGFTQPFLQQPIHHINGFLKELSLRAVSTYTQQAMQLELKSGQLNTDINVTLKGEQLDGNIVILLQGLETAIADSDETGALIDQGALPLNLAMGMLKDSHGNVELDVPLSGSTSDPQFGMSSIVSLITEKAILMATQEYLLKTFIPYANIVSAAMTVGEFALKLRFEDLPYKAKQIAINEDQQAYLQAFIALMQDKEDTRVNICAVSTPADIDLKSGNQITDKSKIKQLKEIAEQREEVFKEYIIKHGNIASSRLLLCSPKIDSSEDAQPRIELSV
ncbi:DUF748 domain-containing protein [Candidatus Colwellia aromaticivorans]|uniref:DUF748 domain-containing protein n=1 Tax=Candidatus Colwellia aromaticivorans TaxID=2267621 RepID=UPI000DF22B9F|nr:DUF748 domain-containing protein [Candidatus Colwellia aromaticivorans]